jgi:tRNA G46 methylase TrmB
MPFMEKVINCLKKEGTIHFATNEKFYADECLDFMTNHWKLQCIQNKIINNESGHIGRTHFERKYLERGELIYDLIFQKKE